MQRTRKMSKDGYEDGSRPFNIVHNLRAPLNMSMALSLVMDCTENDKDRERTTSFRKVHAMSPVWRIGSL